MEGNGENVSSVDTNHESASRVIYLLMTLGGGKMSKKKIELSKTENRCHLSLTMARKLRLSI